MMRTEESSTAISIIYWKSESAEEEKELLYFRMKRDFIQKILYMKLVFQQK